MKGAIEISFIVAIISTIIATILSILLYFLLKKLSFTFRHFIEILITIPIFFPPSVIGYLLLINLGVNSPLGGLIRHLFDFRIIFSKAAAIIVGIIVSVPILYQNFKISLNSVDKSYIEAGRVMGCSEFNLFKHIIFPLSYRGIFSGIILGFGRVFGEFGATILVAGNIPGKTQTIPLAIYSAVESGDDSLANSLVIFVVCFSSILIFLYNFLIGKNSFKELK